MDDTPRPETDSLSAIENELQASISTIDSFHQETEHIFFNLIELFLRSLKRIENNQSSPDQIRRIFVGIIEK